MISPVKYPTEYEYRKIDYYGLFQQQIYIQIWQYATMKENEKIFSLHDYTLQSPMVWDQNELQKLSEELMKTYKHPSPLYWSGRYLQRNLQADDTSCMFEKIQDKEGKDIVTGFDLFDEAKAETIALSIMLVLAKRFRDLKAERNELCKPVNYLTGIWGYGASGIHYDPEVEMTKALQKLNWSKSAILQAQPIQVLEKEDETETETVNLKNGTNLAIGDISGEKEDHE